MNALITGGSRGIGLAIAQKLAKEGCRIFICARHQVQIRLALDTLRELGVEVGSDAFGIGCDVMNPEDIQKTVDVMVGELGSVDILVNNVGGGGSWGKTFIDTPIDTYLEVHKKNAGAMVRFTQLCVPYMVKANWGRVVTIASIYGKEAGGKPWFNMAKSAEISFMKALSQDKSLVRRNITFNTVCPGHTSVEGKPDEPDVDSFPLGRMGRPEEVASVVAFLCSEEASLLNGACITVDGGESSSF